MANTVQQKPFSIHFREKERKESEKVRPVQQIK